MPTMQFMNLGPVARTHEGSVTGSLYGLRITEVFGLGLQDDQTSAGVVKKTMFVFDLRRKLPQREKPDNSARKPVPTPPPFGFKTGKVSAAASLVGMTSDIDQVYIIDLVRRRESVDPEDLRSLFPCADIVSIPQGTTDWLLSNTEEGYRSILGAVDALEETGWTDLAKRTTVGMDAGVGPFEIFLFPAINDGKSASVLVSGENGRTDVQFFSGKSHFQKDIPGRPDEGSRTRVLPCFERGNLEGLLPDCGIKVGIACQSCPWRLDLTGIFIWCIISPATAEV